MIRRLPPRAAPLLAGLAVLSLTLPQPGAGQEADRGSQRPVRMADAPQSQAQRDLAAFIEAGVYELWTRDTVLARGDTVAGPVLLLEATARIAGHIAGSVHAVDADIFLRPGASIAGDLAVLAGGFYGSELAHVAGDVSYRPSERLRVRPASGGFEIIAEVEPEPVFELDGTYGVRTPSYDRVNGLSLPIGATLRPPGLPEVAAGPTWIPARDRMNYRARISTGVGERVRLSAVASRSSASSEEWMRPRWLNSLHQLLIDVDAYDHYESTLLALEAAWSSPEAPSWDAAPRWRLSAAVGAEDATSLETRDVASLLSYRMEDEPEGPRPNPGVDDGRFTFARADFEWSRTDREGATAFSLGAEAGRATGGMVDHALQGATEFSLGAEAGRLSSDDYLLGEARGILRRTTGAGHIIEAFAIARAEMSGLLPSQRHSTLGGIHSLPTLRNGALRGPNLAFAEAAWSVPLRAGQMGGFDLFLRGSAGAAQTSDLRGTLQAGVALRLLRTRLEAGVATGSSEDGSRTVLILALRPPRDLSPARMPR